VAEAVLLSLEAVAGDGPAGEACRAVLGLVSVLSPSGVPRSLLRTAAESGALPGCAGPAGARLADEALGRLAGGSLLTFSGDGEAVSAHRLVMRVVRERAAKDGALATLGTRACALLDTTMRSLGEPWENRAAARDLTGQVTSLHEHLLGSLAGSPELETELLPLRGRALSWLNKLGDAAGQAAEDGRALLTDRERVLGATHPDTLTSRSNLAYAYQDAGRLGEAIPLYKTTLTDRERILGGTHPDTLMSRDNLAAAYRAAGRSGARTGWRRGRRWLACKRGRWAAVMRVVRVMRSWCLMLLGAWWGLSGCGGWSGWGGWGAGWGLVLLVGGREQSGYQDEGGDHDDGGYDACRQAGVRAGEGSQCLDGMESWVGRWG
jgi:hypothetical protein